MGEPARTRSARWPGTPALDTPEERAKLALAELERWVAYERSLIVVAAPTGVGYVNYTFAEALEYLTRGDCAIVVPAVRPGAQRPGPLQDPVPASRMQTLILEGDPRPDRRAARRATGLG